MTLYNLFDLNNNFLGSTDEWPYNHSGCIENDYGDLYYYLNGQFHRIDGPAKIVKLEKEYHEYWIHGKNYTKEQHMLLVDLMKLKGLL